MLWCPTESKQDYHSMNYLAHLHLADNSRTSLAGNLAGDFAKGNINQFAKELQQGIWLHRQIDKITDEHEITHELLTQFPQSHRRIAPILMDLSFDYMLAQYWEEYHSQPLNDFCQMAYQNILKCECLPDNLKLIVPKMKHENWLLAYQSREGLNQAITGVSRRISKPELFIGATEVVEKLDVEIEIAFRTLYPQLMAYSRLLSRKTPAEYL